MNILIILCVFLFLFLLLLLLVLSLFFFLILFFLLFLLFYFFIFIIFFLFCSTFLLFLFFSPIFPLPPLQLLPSSGVSCIISLCCFNSHSVYVLFFLTVLLIFSFPNCSIYRSCILFLFLFSILYINLPLFHSV